MGNIDTSGKAQLSDHRLHGVKMKGLKNITDSDPIDAFEAFGNLGRIV